MEVPVDAGAARELAPDLLLRSSPQEQHAAVLGAAPVRAVVRSFDVAAGRFAAAVLVALLR